MTEKTKYFSSQPSSTSIVNSTYGKKSTYGSYKRAYDVNVEFPNNATPDYKYDLDIALLLRAHDYQVSYSANSQLHEKLMPLILEIVDDQCVVSIDSHNNIYITKGRSEFYPCIVAHTDQVHGIVEEEHYHLNIANNVMYAFDSFNMEQVGTGSDDKAGIYVALEALRHLENVKVVLFADEEIGCQGSSNCNMVFFDDVTIVLQGDRYGNDEWITRSNGVNLCGDDFILDTMTLLEKYGYHDSPYGSLTDVGELTLQGIGVVTANVSIGYVNQHTSREVLHIPSIHRAMNLMLEVAERYSLYQAEYHAPIQERMRGGYAHYNYGDSWDDYGYNSHQPREYATDEVEDWTEYLKTSTSEEKVGGVCPLHHCPVLTDEAEDDSGPDLFFCPACDDFVSLEGLL